mmetsp:Transcript_6443/g.19032  ORF Transcript_6443/g.19032 Transcript_6443/m.19032 type:complete len:1167 (+) Transcript_6443:204-3704(+)
MATMATMATATVPRASTHWRRAAVLLRLLVISCLDCSRTQAATPNAIVTIDGSSALQEDLPARWMTKRADFGSTRDEVKGTIVLPPPTDPYLCNYINHTLFNQGQDEDERVDFTVEPLIRPSGADAEADIIVVVPRGQCAFERKSVAAQSLYNAVGIIITDSMQARYDYNETTGMLLFPAPRRDYECKYGDGIMISQNGSMPSISSQNTGMMPALNPPGYDGAIFDPLLDTTRTDTATCPLQHTAASSCESKLCIVASQQANNMVPTDIRGQATSPNANFFRVCCAWDLPITMQPDGDIASQGDMQKSSGRIVSIFMTIRQSEDLYEHLGIPNLGNSIGDDAGSGATIAIPLLQMTIKARPYRLYNGSMIFLWMLGVAVTGVACWYAAADYRYFGKKVQFKREQHEAGIFEDDDNSDDGDDQNEENMGALARRRLQKQREADAQRQEQSQQPEDQAADPDEETGLARTSRQAPLNNSNARRPKKPSSRKARKGRSQDRVPSETFQDEGTLSDHNRINDSNANIEADGGDDVDHVVVNNDESIDVMPKITRKKKKKKTMTPTTTTTTKRPPTKGQQSHQEDHISASPSDSKKEKMNDAEGAGNKPQSKKRKKKKKKPEPEPYELYSLPPKPRNKKKGQSSSSSSSQKRDSGASTSNGGGENGNGNGHTNSANKDDGEKAAAPSQWSVQGSFELQLYHVAIFAVVASIMLFLLFFFNLYNGVTVLYGIGCAGAVSHFIFGPAIVRLVPKLLGQDISDDLNKHITCSLTGYDIISQGLGFIWAGVWLWYGLTHYRPSRNWFFWLSMDIFGICFCLLVVSLLKLNSIKIATILMVTIFLYDIFFVFITPLLFNGQSVMIVVASGGRSGESTADDFCVRYPDDKECTGIDFLPMLLILPRINDYLQRSVLLGLGDIVLPGFLIAFGARLDAAKRLMVEYGNKADEIFNPPTKWYEGYFVPLMVAYGIGLFFANLAVIQMEMGQPALLYIVPCCLTTIFILGRHELRDIWEGAKPIRLADKFIVKQERSWNRQRMRRKLERWKKRKAAAEAQIDGNDDEDDDSGGDRGSNGSNGVANGDSRGTNGTHPSNAASNARGPRSANRPPGPNGPRRARRTGPDNRAPQGHRQRPPGRRPRPPSSKDGSSKDGTDMRSTESRPRPRPRPREKYDAET